jgi:serine phosphatase RsbU (regulator of sigma subunit)
MSDATLPDALRQHEDLSGGAIVDGDRLVLYSDGVARRRTKDGLFGTKGIASAAASAQGNSASAATRAILQAVAHASEDPLPDDAAVIVLSTNAAVA